MLKNRTILLVDEKPGARQLYSALVSRSNLIDVQGQVGALELMRVRPIDLVLLDVNTPAGLDICRAIRGCWDDVPIIIVAPSDRIEDKVEALDGGADDFISMPFRIEELLARMRAALRRTTSPQSRMMPGRDLVRLPCGHYQVQDEILRLAARISMARVAACDATRPSVGRPKKITTCRKCGASGGTLEMRSHKCGAATTAA